MKEVLIDANLILRYLTKDPPDMAEAALGIFNKARSGKISLHILPLTVAEVVWVLESFYGYPKVKIAETISQFLLCEGLEVHELDILVEALRLFHEKNVDFADAFLAATALQKGPQVICSFDQHFDKIYGITRSEPGNSSRHRRITYPIKNNG
jgi:predicted nucleic acid-binding protein